MRYLLGLGTVVMLAGCLASAQRITTPFQKQYADLTIEVRTQTGQPPNASLKVELLSSTGMPVNTTFTNDSGEVMLGEVQTGAIYVIRVSGPEIEPAASEFTLEASESSHTEWITVTPRVRTNVTSPQGSVALVDLNVPQKALKELGKGNQCSAKNDWSGAAEHYQKAIELYPKYAMAYNNLGSARMNLHDVPGARQAFEQAVAINDKYANAWLHLARLQHDSGDVHGSQQSLLKAIATDPKNVEVLAGLAQVELQLSDFSATQDYVRKANALPHQGFAIIHILGAYALQKQDKIAEAVTEYKLYLQEDPNGAMAEKVRATIATLEKQTTP